MERADGDDEPRTKRQKEVDRLRALFNMRPPTDEGFRFNGVLLSDAIEQCVTAFKLIAPFHTDNLKPACYELTIGDQYAIAGEVYSDKSELTIKPFEVAIIKTHETINMPRFLIGRWNIKVSLAYKGLVWVGGPQVDAGYVGHLFCPIYNLSGKVVTLFKGDPIAVIDFVGTTEFHPNKSKCYPFPPKRVLFEEYSPKELVSGLVTGATARLDSVESQLAKNIGDVKGQIQNTHKRVDDFVSLTFAAVAILFAAISVLVVGKESPTWPYIGVFLLSGLAIFLAASAWVKSRTEGRAFGRSVRVIVVVLLVVALAVHLVWIRDQRKKIDELSNKVHELEMKMSAATLAPTRTVTPQVRTSAPGSEATPPKGP
jgi:deoxycytidine triphosphate deaminase